MILSSFVGLCALAPSAWATDASLAEETTIVEGETSTTTDSSEETTLVEGETATTTDSSEETTIVEGETATTTDSSEETTIVEGTTATPTESSEETTAAVGTEEEGLQEGTTSTLPAEDTVVAPGGIPIPPATDVAPALPADPAAATEPALPGPAPALVEELTPSTTPLAPVDPPPAAAPAEEDPVITFIPDPWPLPEPAVRYSPPDRSDAAAWSPDPALLAHRNLHSSAHRGSMSHHVEGTSAQADSRLQAHLPGNSPLGSSSAVGSGGSVSPSFSPDNSGTGFALLALLLLCLAYGGLIVRLGSTVPRPLVLIYRPERPG